MRRWWMLALSLLSIRHQNLQLRLYKHRHVPDNPVHAEAQQVEIKYKELILQEERAHWEVFLRNARDWNLQV
jgi:hypothetical protein